MNERLLAESGIDDPHVEEEEQLRRWILFKEHLGLMIIVALVLKHRRMDAGSEEVEAIRFAIDWFRANGHGEVFPLVPLALRGFGV